MCTMSDTDESCESEALGELELGEELIDAVRGHDEFTVRELLALGADPNMAVVCEWSSSGNRSILNEAISVNDVRCVVALLEGGADVNDEESAPLKVAVGQNYSTLIESICKAGVEQDMIDASLAMACRIGSKESAFMLLKCGADPANLTVLCEEKRTVLHACSARGDEMVPLALALLDAGAPLENGLPVETDVLAGCTPLLMACIMGTLQLVQLYSSFGAERSPPNARFITASSATTDEVRRWLQESAGWTPLHHASVIPTGRTRALLRAGAVTCMRKPDQAHQLRCSWRSKVASTQARNWCWQPACLGRPTRTH